MDPVPERGAGPYLCRHTLSGDLRITGGRSDHFYRRLEKEYECGSYRIEGSGRSDSRDASGDHSFTVRDSQVQVSASIKIAGDDFDEAIVRYMRKKHNLLIGERTAEDLKIKIGSCYKRAEVDYMDVRGRNLVTGLPKTVKVSSEETEEALRETTAQIVETIHSVLEKTPPELAADIADRGIVLTGGGSLLRGLEDLISAKTGINTMTAEDPMTAVAIGTGKYVEFLAGYREN